MAWNHNFDIKDYIGANGKVIAHNFPGGYPMYYILGASVSSLSHSIACWKCANDNKEEVIQAHSNYEDTNLYCDECDTNIECAYYPTC